LPLLKDHRVSGSRQTPDKRHDNAGKIISKSKMIGDSNGAHQKRSSPIIIKFTILIAAVTAAIDCTITISFIG
jgi:hypothetical protein